MTGTHIRRGKHPTKTDTQQGGGHVKKEVEKGVTLHKPMKAGELPEAGRASPRDFQGRPSQHLDPALLASGTVGE